MRSRMFADPAATVHFSEQRGEVIVVHMVAFGAASLDFLDDRLSGVIVIHGQLDDFLVAVVLDGAATRPIALLHGRSPVVAVWDSCRCHRGL